MVLITRPMRGLVAQIIWAAVQNIEFTTVGEAMLDDYEHLDSLSFHELQIALHDLISEIDLDIKFPTGEIW